MNNISDGTRFQRGEGKNQGIELLRIISAIGIVWFHASGPGGHFAYSGLIVFLILSSYFASVSNNFREKNLTKRVRRLLIPWLFWFLFYGVVNLALGRPLFSLQSGLVACVLAGTSVHLWYMPFTFACLVLLDFLRRYASAKMIALISAFAAAAIIFSSSLWRPYTLLLGAPWAQYIHALAAILIGVFWGLQSHLSIPLKRVLFCLILISLVASIRSDGVGDVYLIACIALFFFAKIGNGWTNSSILESISGCTLGVYFVHIFIMAVYRKVNFAQGEFQIILVILTSFCLILGARKIAPNYAKYIL